MYAYCLNCAIKLRVTHFETVHGRGVKRYDYGIVNNDAIFSLTVTTAKSISDEELQNSSTMILSVRPGNKENSNHRTVILSYTAIAALPEGMKQLSFRFYSKKKCLYWSIRSLYYLQLLRLTV